MNQIGAAVSGSKNDPSSHNKPLSTPLTDGDCYQVIDDELPVNLNNMKVIGQNVIESEITDTINEVDEKT